ncbi:hypothetical protein [Williamsia muralis]|uniref:hypothetical protein n=1 Tax=Williamsia marianensis TaxID=85044 RepID=UPI001FE31D22|nr:hypothetical protein [Williamsia muralis]
MDRPPDATKARVVADACAALSNDDPSRASATLRAGSPFVPTTKVARRYTERKSLRVFYRDGFIDRYSGAQLVHPGRATVAVHLATQ